jgi:predicted nucleotidyltransferase
MNTVGIIAEYNPFHNGHKYHLEQSKKITGADYVVVVMSGNYVQRGEPAIVDKWTRTKMALQNGADIVIELPSIYASSSAEGFAHAAISLLNATGIVSSVCFGSETADISFMKELADILVNEPEPYKTLLKSELSKGLVFPKARANALKAYTKNESSFIESPNNILAIEYIKALNRLKSAIVPYTIQREAAQYHSTSIDSDISSATAIRLNLKNNTINAIDHVIPKESIDTFLDTLNKGIGPIYFDDYSQLLHYKLRTQSVEQLSDILDITEGIENRILNASYSHFMISDIVNFVKTKRYTYTKIQRALLHILLDFKKADIQAYSNTLPYLRVLGFRKSSEALLSNLCKKAIIPVITNTKKVNKTLSPIGVKMFHQEAVSTDTYFLNTPDLSQRTANKEYTTPIIIY